MLLDELTPRQLLEWEIFDRLEGLPTERLIKYLARFTAVLCNCLGAKTITPEMLLREGKKGTVKRQSPAAMKANLQRAVAIHNANQKRKQ